MTTQSNLGLVWALTGGTTYPGSVKYSTGWIVEIPTFQNFNYVLQNATRNALSLAEKGAYDWEDNINYQSGARVFKSTQIHTCITNHINQDPDGDVTNSYWVLGYGVGDSSGLVHEHGVLLKDMVVKTATTWDGSDITLDNDNVVIQFTNSVNTFLLANVSGSMVIIDVGNTEVADGSSIALGEANVHTLFYEGNTGGLDADLLDGQHGTFYQNASNLNAGTIPNARLTTATTSVSGISELSTNSETQAGTSTTRVVTPASLSSRTSTETRTGLLERATQSEAQSGTDNSRAMTPLRVKQSIDVNVSVGATVTSSGSNSNGQFRIWSDGYIEQWGNVTRSATTVTWTFPVAFGNASTVTPTGINYRTAGTQNGEWGLNLAPTTTSVRYSSPQSDTISMYCRATGY